MRFRMAVWRLRGWLCGTSHPCTQALPTVHQCSIHNARSTSVVCSVHYVNVGDVCVMTACNLRSDEQVTAWPCRPPTARMLLATPLSGLWYMGRYCKCSGTSSKFMPRLHQLFAERPVDTGAQAASYYCLSHDPQPPHNHCHDQGYLGVLRGTEGYRGTTLSHSALPLCHGR
jgi:hypothetical protein